MVRAWDVTISHIASLLSKMISSSTSTSNELNEKAISGAK